MKTLRLIVEEIKDIISEERGNVKIFDKDVASVLEISQSQLATSINRNTIPFLVILDFCARKSLVVNSLLYDQLPESLTANTNKYFNHRYHLTA